MQNGFWYLGCIVFLTLPAPAGSTVTGGGLFSGYTDPKVSSIDFLLTIVGNRKKNFEECFWKGWYVVSHWRFAEERWGWILLLRWQNWWHLPLVSSVVSFLWQDKGREKTSQPMKWQRQVSCQIQSHGSLGIISLRGFARGQCLRCDSAWSWGSMW